MENTDLITRLKSMINGNFAAPMILVALLSMVVLPLPPFILDMLFSFNIALSLVIMLASIYVLKPLHFASFPSILLIATLLRLALNVASTRIILLEGHTGTAAAGNVIEAFGEFVIGGNYTVGFVVFAILVIINFVVVTKGATRIAEVSARFTLDSMPGKQMAIDADLNAGLIDQDEARSRRDEIMQESDFYGSMDGASKFVRGDAIAGILILFINIIGGFIIGVVQHDLTFSVAANNYTLLTIGDGLVAQIPSLLLAAAAGLLVTRSTKEQDMGDQIVGQLFQDPKTLAVTSGIIGGMGLIPGMPNLPFLIMAIAGGSGAWLMMQRQKAAAAAIAAPKPEAETPREQRELSWEDLSPVDPIGLEIGYRLIPLVDKNQGGQLMNRIKGIRKKISQELGFLIPPVHIRDNLDLAPTAYQITLFGVTFGEAEIHPDRMMAINPGQVFGELEGIQSQDPAFGLDAVWIEPSQREHAQAQGYTVVDVDTVIATHLSKILQSHAHELLGREEVQQLLDNLSKSAPKLVEGLVPDTIPLGGVQKVLQNLLEENIPVRDIRTIIESISEQAVRNPDPEAITASTRMALSHSIVQHVNGIKADLPIITLDPELEQILLQTLHATGEGGASLEPGLAENMHKNLNDAAQRQEMAGESSILVVQAGLRSWISRFIRHSIPSLNVLSYNEIPDDKQIRIVANVGR
ncbi:MAG: flagellar biosynthesis protein FlhA [Gammaproteobacteria bacterium]|nr:MAG: flagellar biosynthesis protein FlhA [Gammaproteobacteria bacterium]RKZ96486.1 MAG: flagellar biosynthesis protein FlhA [Gammaproteobacteria bacterium]RKZ97690.1 MAG: flagellar biosynthesis protein FlhA [Gammaproteobacteria bacterium]RLA00552.1 MAG: flagellar biosynthesis protein FlhA [Gammaproteobacteria bacterium]